MLKAELAKRLRIQNRWMVNESIYVVQANFTYSGRGISLEFTPTGEGMFQVSFPRYSFTSKISHYASLEPDVRMCQNKALLFHIVSHLKRVLAWPAVANKEFFQVNPTNKKFSRKEASKEMKQRLSKKVVSYRAARDIDKLPGGPVAMKAGKKEATNKSSSEVVERVMSAMKSSRGKSDLFG